MVKVEQMIVVAKLSISAKLYGRIFYENNEDKVGSVESRKRRECVDLNFLNLTWR